MYVTKLFFSTKGPNRKKHSYLINGLYEKNAKYSFWIHKITPKINFNYLWNSENKFV
jgi:hypothetical protein